MIQDKHNRGLIRETEFGPEMAEQRLGWVALTQRGDDERNLQVHIVTTSVGPDGATIDYQPRTEPDRPKKAYWNDAVNGFNSTAALSMLIEGNEKPDDQCYKEARYALGDNGINSLHYAVDGHRVSDKLDEQRQWEPVASLMPKLRNLMDEKGMKEYFPLAYYTANVTFTHPQIAIWARQGRDSEPLGDISVQKLLLPEPTMGPSTELQIEITRSMVQNYNVQIQEDIVMRNNLTVMGAIPAAQIPGAFVRSRRQVGSAEQAIAGARGSLLSYIGIYLPIDSKSVEGSRSWPYMDASETDEDRAFGRELDCLKEGSVNIPAREVERELRELKGRYKYASEGLATLLELRRAEQEASQL
jgi:hypothetical protein